jgi:hypothetical protein
MLLAGNLRPNDTVVLAFTRNTNSPPIITILLLHFLARIDFIGLLVG